MTSQRRHFRNRLWLFVAVGWLALASLVFLGPLGTRNEAAQAREVTAPAGGQSVADGWITTKIKATYAYSRWIDGSAIKVDTIDGIVKLTGSTDSSVEKELAIELAQAIDGVRAVDASGLKVG